MALTSSNVIIIYRDGDSASETLADQYVDLHGLAADQKQAIACSASEVLSDEAEFNTQVLDPVKAAIATVEGGGRTVWAVVLGFNVPGGYYDGDNIISSTSRISRINFSFDRKIGNRLYDRATFKLFDSDDADFALVCTRLDGALLADVTNQLNQTEILKRQLFASGTFYIDPYSDRQGPNAAEYETAILSFQERLLPSLNLETFSTVFLDPYIDAIIPRVSDDSFIWSWFTDRGSPNFFDNTNSIRIFAYNADYDGTETIRDSADRRWPQLYLQNDYCAFAGSMSNPDNDGFLFPYPFFRTLLRGGTLGEAFMFSQPYLDWTISVFGDPLLKVSFPAEINEDDSFTLINERDSFRLMLNDLARSLAYYLRKTDTCEDIRDIIINSQDVATEVDILYQAVAYLNDNNDSQRRSQFKRITESIMQHIIDRSQYIINEIPVPNFNDFLDVSGQKVSELIYDVQPDDDKVDASNFYPEGFWEMERPILDDANALAFYHFELQISDTEDFSNVLLQINSIDNLTGWSYEDSPGNFVNLSIGGVPSRYVDRRIRYKAPEENYLSRAEIYYFRLRQRDQLTFYPYRTWRDIIYT